MDVILYNPKKFNGKPGIPVPNQFNLDKTQKPIILPIGTYEPMAPNTLQRYPVEVANEIVNRWGFVRKVKPEDLENIKKEMAKKDFVCDVAECGYESDTEKGLEMHKRSKHKLSEEQKAVLYGIPMAKELKASQNMDRLVGGVEYSPEGIPKGDVDGWYGPGEEEDLSSSMRLKRHGMAGVF